MRVLDKILDTIKVKDDNAGFEDDGEFFDEEYNEDDFEDEQPRRRIPESRVEEEFEDELPVQDYHEEREPQPVKASTPKASRSSARNSSKVSPIRGKRQGTMEVCVIRPHSMEDAHEITETLQEGCTVILNLEGLELVLAQRLIDYSCGSCYAFRGALQQISRSIFIITPPGVDISGDLQEALNSASFDVPAFGTRF